MAILKIKHKGQKILQQKLEEGCEYFAGRSKENSIVLNADHGISRKHLKISQTDSSSWKVECLSSIGGLTVQSKQVSEHTLTPGDVFCLQNFVFQFAETTDQFTQALFPKEEAGSSEDSSSEAAEESEEEQEEQEEQEPEQEENEAGSSNSNAQNNETPEEDSQKSQQTQKNHFQQGPSAQFQELPENNDPSLETDPSLKIKDPKEDNIKNLNNKTNNQKTGTGTAAPTVVTGHSQMKPTLVISLSEDEKDQTVILENSTHWIIGRDPSCDICVEDSSISRKHFEIHKDGFNFTITDLESANGTSVNDQVLEPQKPHPLKSGSVISILEVEMFFDIINPAIKKESLNLPAALDSPPALTPSLTPSSAPAPPPTPNVIMEETAVMSSPPHSSNKKKRIIITAAVIVIAGLAFFINKKPADKQEPQNTIGAGSPYQSLDTKTQEQVKDLYTLAQQLHQMKKYELCYEKLNTLHSIIPQYEQSLELIKNCKNGAENLRSQAEMERKNKEQEEINKRIAKNIKECRNKFSSFKSIEAIQNCLAFTIEYDPQNFEVTNLVSQFEVKAEEKKRRKIQRQARQKRAAQSLSAYKKARKLKEEKKILKAIDAYEEFLQKKHPSEVSKTISQAQEELTAMKTELNQKLSKLENQCKSQINSKNYKTAYQVCKNILKVLPSHAPALKFMETALTELHKQLKPLYEESVLNESLGQVDIAKKYWSEILDKDVPNGMYYKKAQSKLNKY